MVAGEFVSRSVCFRGDLCVLADGLLGENQVCIYTGSGVPVSRYRYHQLYRVRYHDGTQMLLAALSLYMIDDVPFTFLVFYYYLFPFRLRFAVGKARQGKASVGTCSS